MTSRDFAYWLQGFFEISDPLTITPAQLNNIKKHLNLVFQHEIDPSMGDEKHQQKLNEIHSGLMNNIDHFNSIPQTEEEAIIKWGPKPSPKHVYNLHGWYNPAEGTPRC